jgi:hypothetical protein
MDRCTVSGVLMLDQLLTYGLYGAGYVFQAFLLGVLLARGHRKRLAGVCIYLTFLLLLDGVARSYTLIHYGLRSAHHEYYYVYWLTDVVLTVLAFALVCWFFRRACAGDEKMWHNLRPLLGFLFLLLAAISYFMIASKFQHFYSDFIFQFSQNTYFACLVLTTLLYIMIQRSEVRDEELGMLVCGMGILFAAPAAGAGAYVLLPKSAYVNILIGHLYQLCMLGMLFTWWYAITRLPHGATVRADVAAMARA